MYNPINGQVNRLNFKDNQTIFPDIRMLIKKLKAVQN